MEMKSKPCVCFCPWDTGVAMSGFLKRRKNLSKKEEESFLSMMKNLFSFNVSGHSAEIHTFIVLLNLRSEHWGILIGMRYMDVD